MRLVRWFIPLLAAGFLGAVPPRPKLVVVISVDQFSADLMARWAKDMPGGLGRLWREGTTFTDAWQDHAYTETGPGHSVILTGRHPMHTGITENVWLDRALGRNTYCVEDPAGALVGALGTPVGPAHLSGSTLGEWLTDQVKGSRSFAVTGKDRSAILMAGHRAQGVYWFNGPGGFTTSRAYASTLPGWLAEYNTRFLAGLGRDLDWTPLETQGLPPTATYTVHGRPLTMGLPRAIHAQGRPLDAGFWSRYRASPFLDAGILGAAEALEAGEHLGRGPATDLLALGLSATDYVGHRFGNSGPEMLDQLRRLDRELGAYLDRLKARVPGLWVVLTADHGAADFPERLQARGENTQRLSVPAWAVGFNAALLRKLGGTRNYFLPSHGQQFYLDLEAVAQSGHARAEVLAAAVAQALATPEVAEACSADELADFRTDGNEPPAKRSLKAKLRNSFTLGRSGELLLAFKPAYSVDDPTEVAGHGHPQPWDQRVPLIFWGPWRTERRDEPIRIIDLAPTLASELGLKTPEGVDGHKVPLAEK